MPPSRRAFTLETMQAVRKMAQIKTEIFTATSEADARAKAAAWKAEHPTLKLIAEHKPIAAAPLGSTQPGRRKHLARLVSISIDYQD
jgi:hypothetical protein